MTIFEVVQSMADAIFSSRPLHINFRKQTVKGYRITVCVIHTKDRVLLDSSDSACKRPLDGTECDNDWEDAIKDMYNTLLGHSDDYLTDLMKKRENTEKEVKAWEEAMKKRASGV